ncbi:helix-turn-helix domain-containing protein [Sphingobium sp. B11D3A]|uniref:helix-turn-helix domain-containing protein n=1 Tax=Sphingobium sp. B11D3A TaxID=2940574 RepID=UPI0039B41E07
MKVQEARKELGRKLLSDPSADVPEVACILGFQDTTSFYRAFRGWEGVTPQVWRSRNGGVRGAEAPAPSERSRAFRYPVNAIAHANVGGPGCSRKRFGRPYFQRQLSRSDGHPLNVRNWGGSRHSRRSSSITTGTPLPAAIRQSIPIAMCA